MKSCTETDAAMADVTLFATLDRAILEQEFDSLLAANGPALARLAASYTNTSSDRDDLLQEIALAVWQALRAFRGECSPRTFLFRIAHNRAIAHLSRSQARFPAAAGDVEVMMSTTRPPIRNPALRGNRPPDACAARFIACRWSTAKSSCWRSKIWDMRKSPRCWAFRKATWARV